MTPASLVTSDRCVRVAFPKRWGAAVRGGGRNFTKAFSLAGARHWPPIDLRATFIEWFAAAIHHTTDVIYEYRVIEAYSLVPSKIDHIGRVEYQHNDICQIQSKTHPSTPISFASFGSFGTEGFPCN